MLVINCTAQSQKAVSAYFTSKADNTLAFWSRLLFSCYLLSSCVARWITEYLGRWTLMFSLISDDRSTWFSFRYSQWSESEAIKHAKECLRRRRTFFCWFIWQTAKKRGSFEYFHDPTWDRNGLLSRVQATESMNIIIAEYIYIYTPSFVWLLQFFSICMDNEQKKFNSICIYTNCK